MQPLLIKPIQFGELQEKTANAITWQVNGLIRGATEAHAECSLIFVKPDGGTEYVSSFNVTIDNTTLQSWGADDSVIDDVVLAYSPLFERETE
ncbi:MAG: hypothetical protein ACKOPP_03730 [Bacteroidota bacterium]